MYFFQGVNMYLCSADMYYRDWSKLICEDDRLNLYFWLTCIFFVNFGKLPCLFVFCILDEFTKLDV